MEAKILLSVRGNDAQPKAIRAMQAMLDERDAAIRGLSMTHLDIASLQRENAVLKADRKELLRLVERLLRAAKLYRALAVLAVLFSIATAFVFGVTK